LVFNDLTNNNYQII